MRTPIAHALAWPHRMPSGVDTLDILSVGQLKFEPADLERFPCLRLGYEAAKTGGTTTAVLNAANEIAVEAFLREQIRFTDIHRVIEWTLEEQSVREADSLDTVLDADASARGIAHMHLTRLSSRSN